MLTETQLLIADGVAKNGWFTVNYAPSSPSDPDEVFTYTVGLTKTAGWAEIIVFGLDPDRSFAMLADLLEACWEQKTAPQPGMTINGIVQDLPIKLVEFGKESSLYFTHADWFARHVSTRKPLRLQLLWPDRQGKLPDDPACDPEIRAKQNFAVV